MNNIYQTNEPPLEKKIILVQMMSGNARSVHSVINEPVVMNNKVNLNSNAQTAPSEHFTTKANIADLNLGAPSAPPTYNHGIPEGRNRQNSLVDSDSDSDNSHLSRGFRKSVSDRKTIKELREALEVETKSNLRKLER